MKHPVASVDELEPGQMKAIELERKSILLARNDEGDFYAIRNVCPHKGVPLSLGTLGGTMAACDYGEYRLVKKGEVVRCPWHSWEFDVTTGCSLVEPESCWVKTYSVTVEAGTVYISEE
jgi:nitrite reductase (NADH) small subunit